MQTLFESGGVARTLPLAREPKWRVASPGSARALLKRSTQALHVAVERSLDLPAHTESIADYRRLLERLFGFYEPLERRLAGLITRCDIGLDFEPRRKLPLLRHDLRDMESRGDALPLCGQLPAIDAAADALGCLYVLEGSTLGGRVITRLLADRLRLTPETGAAFFASYGDRVDPMWAEFCGVLESFAERHPAQQDSLVHAAQATFRSLGDWLASSP